MFVINREGVLVYQGAIDDRPNVREADTMKAINYVKAALAALKSGKPVQTVATQAYGCAIKYGRDTWAASDFNREQLGMHRAVGDLVHRAGHED